MHEVESLVDPLERDFVRDQAVDLDLAFHVPVDDPRDVRTTTSTAEGGALPHASGDQLERSRRDFLACACDADDDADAPASMTALERLAHELHVADALEAVIRATARQLDEVRSEIAADVFRIHEVRHAESSCERLTGRVDVDADDHVRARPCERPARR